VEIDADETILSRIVESPWLSARLLCLTTTEEAITVYESARLIPQSETRAIAVGQGITIDCQLQFPGPQTAIFFRAFENTKDVMVLKVNRDASKSKSECRLYDMIGKDAKEGGIALVPVRLLVLDKASTHQSVTSSPPRALHPFQGILMPCYPYTLSDIPKGIPCSYAIEIFRCIILAVDFIHDREWFHGDIKSANIFCTDRGSPRLGDYGSSVDYSNRRFSLPGGTPRYQCVDISYIESPRLFDGVGLVLSLLEKLGRIELREDQELSTVLQTIDALEGIDADELRGLLKEWIRAVQTK
jgi:hypothetical protein